MQCNLFLVLFLSDAAVISSGLADCSSSSAYGKSFDKVGFAACTPPPFNPAALSSGSQAQAAAEISQLEEYEKAKSAAGGGGEGENSVSENWDLKKKFGGNGEH